MSEVTNLELKIKELQEQAASPEHSVWSRYADIYNKMSPDQQAFVLSSDSIAKAESELMTGFNLYLFEKLKEGFAIDFNGKYRPYVDSYIDTMAKSAEEYAEKAKHLVEDSKLKDEEIARLKEELAKKQEAEDVRRY